MTSFAYYKRKEDAGFTVAKESLPDGEFDIVEYCWGDISLWFVVEQEFTADERQVAYEAYMGHAMNLE